MESTKNESKEEQNTFGIILSPRKVLHKLWKEVNSFHLANSSVDLPLHAPSTLILGPSFLIKGSPSSPLSHREEMGRDHSMNGQEEQYPVASNITGSPHSRVD